MGDNKDKKVSYYDIAAAFATFCDAMDKKLSTSNYGSNMDVIRSKATSDSKKLIKNSDSGVRL